MVMMRIRVVLRWTLIAMAFGAGCNKPSEESCRKALANMRVLLHTDNATENTDAEGDVRRCKGGSSKKAVECAIAAKTLDDLRKCGFTKVPDTAPGTAPAPTPAPTPAPGSGSAPAAGSGSAPTPGSGSAPTPGSGSAPAPGSGSAPAPGSGSG
jgi:hypothetical protein